MKPLLALLAGALALLVMVAPASAQTTYKYDALGRLVEVRDTSDTSDIATYTYDPADNRTKVKSGNAAPSAIGDWYFLMTTGSTWSGVLSVLDNDTDADLPDDTLSVTSVSGSYTSLATDGIGITSAPVGYHSASYTMRDANGSTSGADVYYQVVYCNPFCELDP